MINIQHIIRGWGNVLKDYIYLLDEDTKARSQSRLLICDTCEFRKIGICIKCGCSVIAKSMVEEEHCPENKW